MELDNPRVPTETIWQTIEHLSDILSETTDLQQAFKTGLEVLLTTMGRAGGALYVPRFCEHITQDWTLSGIPGTWEIYQNGRSSQARPLRGIIQEIMQTGQPVSGQIDLELGAAFPIRNEKTTVGVLLLCGPEVPPEEYPIWQSMLRPFSRTVFLHAKVSGNASGIPSYIDLLRSRNTLRAMFDSLPISIYIIDATYSLLAVNYSRSERVGEKPNQLVGGKCYQQLFHRTTPCPACRVSETFATAQNTLRLSRDWLDHDKFVEWEISTFPIMDETADNNGSEFHKEIVAQAILIEQDVTEKRNLEANLIQSEKLAAVGQLAAGVAHEINNPLTAIIANAQILRREVPSDDIDLIDSIKLIEMAGTRASQVVRNLLGIARKEKYEFEPIDLNETLHASLSLVQHELVGRPIQVQLNLAENMPNVLASRDQLQGVWINLILNAIDAVDKENGQISISTQFTGKEFHISVMDNGKGIAADHLSRVFEPFFTTKSAGRGTGLGLSVCMRVIRQHGGDIQVDSQLGRWTRFTVILPAQKSM